MKIKKIDFDKDWENTLLPEDWVFRTDEEKEIDKIKWQIATLRNKLNELFDHLNEKEK